MATQTLSSLDPRTLARRLGELAGDERKVQVEFLQHLAEFDRRRAYLELGYGSLCGPSAWRPSTSGRARPEGASPP